MTRPLSPPSGRRLGVLAARAVGTSIAVLAAGVVTSYAAHAEEPGEPAPENVSTPAPDDVPGTDGQASRGEPDHAGPSSSVPSESGQDGPTSSTPEPAPSHPPHEASSSESAESAPPDSVDTGSNAEPASPSGDDTSRDTGHDTGREAGHDSPQEDPRGGSAPSAGDGVDDEPSDTPRQSAPESAVPEEATPEGATPEAATSEAATSEAATTPRPTTANPTSAPATPTPTAPTPTAAPDTSPGATPRLDDAAPDTVRAAPTDPRPTAVDATPGGGAVAGAPQVSSSPTLPAESSSPAQAASPPEAAAPSDLDSSTADRASSGGSMPLAAGSTPPLGQTASSAGTPSAGTPLETPPHTAEAYRHTVAPGTVPSIVAVAEAHAPELVDGVVDTTSGDSPALENPLAPTSTRGATPMRVRATPGDGRTTAPEPAWTPGAAGTNRQEEPPRPDRSDRGDRGSPSDPTPDARRSRNSTPTRAERTDRAEADRGEADDANTDHANTDDATADRRGRERERAQRDRGVDDLGDEIRAVLGLPPTDRESSRRSDDETAASRRTASSRRGVPSGTSPRSTTPRPGRGESAEGDDHTRRGATSGGSTAGPTTLRDRSTRMENETGRLRGGTEDEPTATATPARTPQDPKPNSTPPTRAPQPRATPPTSRQTSGTPDATETRDAPQTPSTPTPPANTAAPTPTAGPLHMIPAPRVPGLTTPTPRAQDEEDEVSRLVPGPLPPRDYTSVPSAGTDGRTAPTPSAVVPSPRSTRPAVDWPSGIVRDGNGDDLDAERHRPADVLVVPLDGTSWRSLTAASALTPVRSGKARLVLTTPLLPTAGASLQDCASGEYRTRWREFAAVLRSLPNAPIVDLGTGMNREGTPWSGDPRTYAQCWSEVARTVKATAPNVVFQWTPALGSQPGMPGESVLAAWPEHDLVDIVGVDATADGRPWAEQVNGAYGLNYWAAFADDRGRRVAVARWGVHPGATPDRAVNAAYIRNVHDWVARVAAKDALAYEAYTEPADVPPAMAEAYRALF